MSLERILQALDAEAERQIAALKQTTQLEIERICTQAQVEAEATRQKHLDASGATLQIERTRLLNRARQEALQTVLNARESLLAAALESAARHLAALATSEHYPAYLRRLTQEAMEHVGQNGPCCLHVYPQDVEVMSRIVREMGCSVTVQGDLAPEMNPHPNPRLRAVAGVGASSSGDSLGGVEATTPDGRIRLANTLAARLHRAASLYRAQIAEIVFDQEVDRSYRDATGNENTAATGGLPSVVEFSET